MGEDTAIPVVPAGHPRLYVRREGLDEVRRRVGVPVFADTWALVQASEAPVCKAFVHLVTGDEERGRQAVAEGLTDLTAGHDGRPFYNAMHKAACIYDWCYAMMSNAERQAYIEGFKAFAAKDHNRGYPPNPETARSVTGHDCEGFVMTNLMPAGVAIHDEDPEMYCAAAEIFFTQHLPASAFYYPAHMHHQGTHYNGERFVHDIATAWMFRVMGAPDIYPPDQQFVLYQLIYALRPDGQFMKMGDDNDGPGDSLHKRLPARLAGMFYGDPHLLHFSECKAFSRSQQDFYAIFDLLFLEPGEERSPFDALPLTKYFAFPIGSMTARTGWEQGVDSRTAMVQMHIGELYYSNHHHRDYGTFQIYYRGPLALDTGVYQGGEDSMYGTDHWRDYYQQTVAHNGLLVFDPATMATDHGGQQAPTRETRTLASLQAEDRRLGRVTGRAFGPDPVRPTYSYIAGDITRAYGAKTSCVTRAMVTLNTGLVDYPCVVVVFDRVVAADPAFEKVWLLHSVQEPSVAGQRTTIVCDGEAYHGGRYCGRLVVDTLLPAGARIDAIGGPGKAHWNAATQRDYPVVLTHPRGAGDEPGAWRIEVRPPEPSKEDRFLHVMSVMDTGTAAPETAKVQIGGLVGVRVLSALVLFLPEGDIAGPLEIEANAGTTQILICGLHGGRWTVERPGGEAQDVSVDIEANCLFLETDGDAVTLLPHL